MCVVTTGISRTIVVGGDLQTKSISGYSDKSQKKCKKKYMSTRQRRRVGRIQEV